MTGKLNQQFADVSNNNPAFNAHAYASAGYALIVLKATEGTGFTDATHAARCEASHAAGLPVVHYHFCRPGTGDVLREAHHFWDVVRPHFRRGVDALAFDLETDIQPRDAPRYLAELDNETHRYSTLEAVAYLPLSFIQEAGPGLQVRSRRFWVAAWGPPVAPLGANRAIWAQQHTDGQQGPGPHSAAGIGACDMSTLRPSSTRLFDSLHRRAAHR